MISGPRHLLRRLFRRTAVEDELDDEVRHFLALATEERVRAGMSREDAARAARVELGGVAVVKETVRRGSPANALETTVRDVRYALRQIGRAPVFTGIAVTLLAIGIGANAAFLSYLDAWLYRTLPGVEDPDGVMRVTVGRTFDYGSGPRVSGTDLSIDEFYDLRDRQHVFAPLGMRIPRGVVFDVGDHPVTETADFVSSGYLETMRPRMAAGGIFAALDDRSMAADPVVIIRHDLWTMRFGGAPDVVGRTIRLNGIPFTIRGVMPAGFRGSSPLVVPLAARHTLFPDEAGFLRGRGIEGGMSIVGRLRDGVSVEEALAATNGIAAHLRQVTNRDRALAAAVSSMTSRGQDSLQALETIIVGGIPVLILLIACANVSILLLGRAVVRQREVAVRLALGAGRLRVIRQLLAESSLLALLATAMGLLVLIALGGVIESQFNVTLAPSWRTIAITVAFAGGTGFLFGLIPALHVTSAGVSDALKESSAGLDRRRTRLQRGFVVAEVAMSMALVCLTGLFVQAARASMDTDVGMDISDRVLATMLDFPMANYSSADATAFAQRARERVAALPNVESVSIIDAFHLGGTGEVSWSGTLPVAADSAGRRARSRRVYVRGADVDFFRTLDVPIEGREFLTTDVATSMPVAIVDEASAKILWPGGSPIGQLLVVERERVRMIATLGGGRLERTPGELPERIAMRVVGVAGVIQGYSDLTRNGIVTYQPLAQGADSTSMMLVVRAPGASRDLAPAIHAIIRELEPRLPLSPVQTTAALHADRYTETRDVGLAGTIAGLIALFLACVGVYAVIAFGVAQRTREIGIRIALGASAREVIVLFFRDGLRLALIGFFIGVPLTIIALKVGSAEVFDTQMLSVSRVMLVVVILLSVAALASWVPARRAARINPVDALRSE